MVIFKQAIPRRTFLRGVGATLALPVLDAMTPAFAAPATRPTRMVFMQTPNGIMNLKNEWTPKTEGADWEMTRTLEIRNTITLEIVPTHSIHEAEFYLPDDYPCKTR